MADSSPEDWFAGPLGARVLREEAALAPLALDNVFGFELLQVGAWGPARHLFDGARTQHATLVAPDLGPGVTLCAPLIPSRLGPTPSMRFFCRTPWSWSRTLMRCCARPNAC